MASKFGDFIAEKRKALNISLRSMADKLDIAAPYLSDIEKGRRNPPGIEMLNQMAKILGLTNDERDLLFDLAGEEKNQVSPDLPTYIMETPEARTALRKARDRGIDAEFWKKINEKIDEEG